MFVAAMNAQACMYQTRPEYEAGAPGGSPEEVMPIRRSLKREACRPSFPFYRSPSIPISSQLGAPQRLAPLESILRFVRANGGWTRQAKFGRASDFQAP
jgi:hypothetical protein